MSIFGLILFNLLLFALLRRQVNVKVRKSFSISLRDLEGNKQTLADTISFLLEQNKVQEQRLFYLAKEMEVQWSNIELIKENLQISDDDLGDHPFTIPEDTKEDE